MINLLPPAALAAQNADYRARRRVVGAAVVLALALIALIAGGALLITSRQEAEAVAAALEAAKKNPELATVRSGSDAIKLVNDELPLFPVGKKARPPLSALVADLAANRPKGIALTDLLYDGTGKELRLGLQGRAATRQNFLDFIAALKADQRFAAVDSPITNVIRDRELNFNITLKLQNG